MTNKTAAGETPRTDQEWLANTEMRASYWLKGGREANDQAHAVLACESAINAWKNLAYGFSEQLSALRAELEKERCSHARTIELYKQTCAALRVEADGYKQRADEAMLMWRAADANIKLVIERAEAAEQKYLLLSAQHSRLCDQVYEEDGETLKQVAAEQSRDLAVADAIEQAKAACAALNSADWHNPIGPQDCIDAIDKITPAAVRAAVEAQRKDASMWQWARKHLSTTLIVHFFGNGCVNRTMKEVEAEIYAAQAQEQGERG